MEKEKIQQISELLDISIKALNTAKTSLSSDISEENIQDIKSLLNSAGTIGDSRKEGEEGEIVEGIFDGEKMIDSTGKTYPVPLNYSSKSKLVEGDGLKLTIGDSGRFLYKQIQPVERKHLIGTLTLEDGTYKVIADGVAYKVILAAVTYFKAEIGGRVTIIVPADKKSTWAAIESVLHGEEF